MKSEKALPLPQFLPRLPGGVGRLAPRRSFRRLRDFSLANGILYVLISAPLEALFVGFIFRVVPLSVATVVAFAFTFALLPVIVAALARDASSALVRELPKYALWALAPYTVYNLARVAVYPLLGVVFWDQWYAYGAGTTAMPLNTWASLLPGTLVHSLQGWVLAFGFYVLLRPRLRNALLYGFLMLSLAYSWFFPSFVLTRVQLPLQWYFVVWWAHFWFGLTLWATPRLLGDPRVLAWFKRPPGLACAAAVWVAPYVFVFATVQNWQFPLQEATDEQTIRQLRVKLQEGPVLAAIAPIPGSAGPSPGDAAYYTLTLTIGPRRYTDYLEAPKALEIGPLYVQGHILYKGNLIASCSAYKDALDTASDQRTYARYLRKVEEIDFSTLKLECVGPVETANQLIRETAERGMPLIVAAQWTARLHVAGDRLSQDRTYVGQIVDAPLQIDQRVKPAP